MIKKIESTFRKYDGDGEFAIDRRDWAFSIIGAKKKGTLIYCTRPAMFMERMGNLPYNIGLIGKYGLPNPMVIDWLIDAVGERAVLFLGDLDPVDFLIFLWIRLQLSRNNVRYLGISDDFIERCKLKITPQCTIKLSKNELTAMDMINNLPFNISDITGLKCMGVMKNGGKIELAYAISSARHFKKCIFDSLVE